ncbi:MAG: hypothetical protein ACR2G7_08535 [Acidimicrobiales bacterium]
MAAPGDRGHLLAGLVLANPTRISRRSTQLRAASIALIFVITATNAWSAGRLVDELLHGGATTDATSLLLTAASVWLTNVVAFALWYWEMDRGGPAARAHFAQPHLDLLFAQMQNPELPPADWEPTFVGYLYLSFTQRHRRQPHRRPPPCPLGQAHDARAVGGLAPHRGSRHRPRREHPQLVGCCPGRAGQASFMNIFWTSSMS